MVAICYSNQQYISEKKCYFTELTALNVNMNTNRSGLADYLVEDGRAKYLKFIRNQKIDLPYLQVRRLFEGQLTFHVGLYGV